MLSQIVGSSLQRVREFGDHPQAITAVIFVDQNRALSACKDGVIRMWDVTSGTELEQFRTHPGTVRHMALCSLGILTAGDDGTVRIWNLSGEVLRVFGEHSAAVTCVDVSADSGRVVSCDSAGSVLVWSASTGALEHRFEVPASRSPRRAIPSVAISAEGRHVAAGAGSSIVVWDLVTRGMQTIFGHSDWVCRVDLSKSGRFVVSGSHDGTVRLWDRSRITEVRRLVDNSTFVKFVEYSEGGYVVATTAAGKFHGHTLVGSRYID